MNYSKGICWIDDCRIPFVDEKVPRLNVSYEHKTNNNFGGGNDNRYGTSTQSVNEGQGRFPANLLVSDDMLNDGSISKSEGGKTTRDTAHFGGGIFKMEGYGDKGTNSRYYDIDKWFDKMINEL